MKQVSAVWQNSPSAMAILSGRKLEQVNPALVAMLELDEPDVLLANENWFAPFAKGEHGERLNKFLLAANKELQVDIFTAKNNDRCLRILKQQYDQDGEVKYVLVFQDLTLVQENARAFQVGYDEFMKVSIDLEKALDTINNQKNQLEKQKAVLENELRIAHILQRGIIQQNFNQYKHVNVAGYYEAMKSLGGDMWEFYENSNSFIAVLGDVMGHGVASSLISIMAKTLFKKQFEELNRNQSSQTVSKILDVINHELLSVIGGQYFITAGLVHFNADYQMQFSTAGHPAILLVTHDGQIKKLQNEQPILGMFEMSPYSTQTVQLAPQDRVLLYTDGLIESHDDSGEILSLDSVAEVMLENREKPMHDTLQDLLLLRHRFTGTTELPDDLAMVCLEIPEKSK